MIKSINFKEFYKAILRRFPKDQVYIGGEPLLGIYYLNEWNPISVCLKKLSKENDND